MEVRLYHGFRRLRDVTIAPAAALLVRLGVAPWAVSLAGVVAALCTFFVPEARPELAFLPLAAAVSADALDGAVARRSGRACGAGKLFDQACDSATFAVLAVASAALGLASFRVALAAAVACTLATAAALRAACHNDPAAFRACPRAGSWGHLPKLSFAALYPVVLLGGPRALLPPALALSAVLGVLVTVVHGVSTPLPPTTEALPGALPEE